MVLPELLLPLITQLEGIGRGVGSSGVSHSRNLGGQGSGAAPQDGAIERYLVFYGGYSEDIGTELTLNVICSTYTQVNITRHSPNCQHWHTLTLG